MEKAGEPFAMLGVNFRDKLEHIQSVKKEKDLNWRSFFAGEDVTIVQDFGVEYFPTSFVIDAEGFIRDIDGDTDNVINELLAEMKK